jgi:exopolysaccharide production protein ExoZ
VAIAEILRNAFDVPRGATRTIRPMEGLRGIAVFLVFLVHYCTLVEPWLPAGSTTLLISSHVYNIGNAGVDLFFVLSGYLIYRMVLTKRTPFLRYLRRRVQRIYPAFLVVLGIYLVLATYLPGQREMANTWPLLALYVGENVLLLPGLFPIQPIVTVAWSLSYEVFYYLLVPLAVWSLTLREWPARTRIMLWLAVAVTGFGYFRFNAGHIRLLMFVAGIVVCDALEGPLVRVRSPVGLVSFVAAIVSMVIIKEFALGGWLRFVLLFCAFVPLCLDAFAESGLTSALLSWTPLRAFGNMSYSYYLIHGLTLKAAFLVIATIARGQHPWMFWAFLGPMFAATLVPSALLFAFVEKPFSLMDGRVPELSRPTLAVLPASMPDRSVA